MRTFRQFVRRGITRCIITCIIGGTLESATVCQADETTAKAAKAESSKAIDASVTGALEYLAGTQHESGSWSSKTFGQSTATTSLAVMSYLAAGHVPGEGPYGQRINRAVRWVIDHQRPDGMIVHQKSHGPFYSHGISTLMLAEVSGMLAEPLASECKAALEKGIRLTLKAQNVAKPAMHQGGWRYHADSRDSDLSVTGWQLLALRAAKDIGCDVPIEQIDKAIRYVQSCKPENHPGFSYQRGGTPTATRTGTGILALEICGSHRAAESIQAADWLLAHPLQFDDHYFFYGAYYGGIGMFKMGGNHWERTKARLVNTLLENQYPDGSWLAKLGQERSVGRVYCTSMAVLALTVEYRYLPIYQR